MKVQFLLKMVFELENLIRMLTITKAMCQPVNGAGFDPLLIKSLTGIGFLQLLQVYIKPCTTCMCKFEYDIYDIPRVHGNQSPFLITLTIIAFNVKTFHYYNLYIKASIVVADGICKHDLSLKPHF